MSVPRDHAPPRFSLAALIEFTAAVALFLALVTQLGALGFLVAVTAFFVFLLVSHALLSSNSPNGIWNEVKSSLLLGLGFLLLAIWVLSQPFRVPRISYRYEACKNNLKYLVLAFHYYHDDHGHFPPPYIADANGKPMHSWRVLILPYIEEQALYQSYNFKEPWNGPNNSKLTGAMPDLFRCPSDAEMPANMTNYFYVVDPRRMKPGSKQTLKDFKDERTIVLVESASARVNWLEPRDLTVEEVLARKNTRASPSASSFHSHEKRRSARFFNVAFHDGGAISIRSDIDRDTLKALLTIDGREEVDLSHLRPPDPEPPRFGALVALTVAFVVFAILRRVHLARRRVPK